MKVKKVSQIFGKSVISSSGKEGYVLGFIRDKNQITALICADENEKRFSILPEKLEGDKIFYDKKIATCSGGKGISLGKPAFNLSGKYLGKLYDYVCSGLCLT
jgi:sporulation protein YlmC with PRC-barrel domain